MTTNLPTETGTIAYVLVVLDLLLASVIDLVTDCVEYLLDVLYR